MRQNIFSLNKFPRSSAFPRKVRISTTKKRGQWFSFQKNNEINRLWLKTWEATIRQSTLGPFPAEYFAAAEIIQGETCQLPQLRWQPSNLFCFSYFYLFFFQKCELRPSASSRAESRGSQRHVVSIFEFFSPHYFLWIFLVGLNILKILARKSGHGDPHGVPPFTCSASPEILKCWLSVKEIVFKFKWTADVLREFRWGSVYL